MIFKLVQKNLVILGISKKQSIYSFYGKALIGFLLLGINVLSHFQFLSHDDITFEEYTESLYMTTIAVLSLLCYASMILKNEEYFDFIDKFKSIIQLFNKSQCKCLYFSKLKLIKMYPKYFNPHFI